MADDFTMRLIHVYGQVIDCLKWSIDNKHLDCVGNLRPVVQSMASIMADMIDRQEEDLKRRGKMELSRNVGLGARPTSCNGRVMEEDYSMAKAEPELLLNKSEVDRTFSLPAASPATRVGAPRINIGSTSIPYLVKKPCSCASQSGTIRAVKVA